MTVAPAIILVSPQLGENIGAAARVMANFALSDLRLVAPRDGWPNPAAEAMAAKTLSGPVEARVFDTVDAAVADLSYLLAATARPRGFDKPAMGPRQAMGALRARAEAGAAAGVLFGAEAMGLLNEDVARADAILTYPVSPDWSSLNLAQAVALAAYEWGLGEGEAPHAGFDRLSPPASKAEIAELAEHFETELEASGFFWPPEKAQSMRLSVRAAVGRWALTAQDVSTLRGMIKALARGTRRKPKT